MSALRAFGGGLETTGSSSASLRAVAPSLAVSLDRVRRSSAVISAARLSDARVERQRVLVAPGLSRVVTSMDRVLVAARIGDRVAFDRARAELRAATEALRSAASGRSRGGGTGG